MFYSDVVDCSELEKRPLSDAEIARLNSSLQLLLDHVHVEILVNDLYSNGCISRWQKEHLKQKSVSSSDQVSEMIEILVRRSFADFELFLDMLDDSGHQHVARVLRAEGADVTAESSKDKMKVKSDVVQPDTLPLKLLELILMKAAVGIHDRFQVCLLLRHRAEELTLATFFYVCRKWWYVITNRKWNRRCLRRTFTSKSTIMPLELLKAIVIFRNELKTQPRDSREADIEVFTNVSAVCCHWHKSIATCRDISIRQIKRQLKYGAQLLKVVPVKESRFSLGVTYCDGMLLAVDYYILHVFVGDTTLMFDISKSSTIATEMVSCNDTIQLFVAYICGDIWRVNFPSMVNRPISINKFVHHEGGVESMSLTRRRLLVTPRYNKYKVNSLVVYDVVSGERLQSVQLPTFMRATHSIETTNNVFIVSHVGESRDHRGVSEVNGEGHVTRAFNGLLHDPCYLTLDSLGRVLVLDEKWNVLLLSRELKYERVLVDMQQLVDKQTTTEQTSRTLTSLISPLFPLWRRMCYDKKTRRLFVRVSYNEREIGGEILILKC